MTNKQCEKDGGKGNWSSSINSTSHHLHIIIWTAEEIMHVSNLWDNQRRRINPKQADRELAKQFLDADEVKKIIDLKILFFASDITIEYNATDVLRLLKDLKISLGLIER
jgi:hypothetical protein